MELTIEVGKFGEGIDPREHVCRRCLRSVVCGLQSWLGNNTMGVSTGYDTVVMKVCPLFEPTEEEG